MEASMLKDFEKVKEQLHELAPLIKGFPEATQKPLVEALFADTEESQGYDRRRLEELWNKRDYKQLVLAAGDEGGRLREPRFVMEGRTAHETRRMARVTAGLAVATAIFAGGTLIVELAKLFPELAKFCR
jgi:hypothetical protein